MNKCKTHDFANYLKIHGIYENTLLLFKTENGLIDLCLPTRTRYGEMRINSLIYRQCYSIDESNAAYFLDNVQTAWIPHFNGPHYLKNPQKMLRTLTERTHI